MIDFNFKNYNPRNLAMDVKSKFLALNKEKRKAIILTATLFVVFYFCAFSHPYNFPVGVIIEIEKGETLKNIAKDFKEKGIIKSSFLFDIIVRGIKGNQGVISGDYFFESSKNVFSIAHRTTKGIFGLTPVRVTIFEGTTVEEMADILSKKLEKFNPESFIEIAKRKQLEGYLFPDTYLFSPNISEDDVIIAMKDNFDKKVLAIQDKIDACEKPLDEIIIMASILEEEARTMNSKKVISGILWKRIEIGMPLQVDAVFPYILGRNTYQVTLDDLKVDSKYNTYLYKGLPVGPITNPGLNSIIAAINPVKSDYLYYLSDREGNMYYAVDFEGHKENRVLYLN
ncbi:endolytic transglycosylase MltG [Patescibacteria group bacterium]|nr:endolytic transglycosylase MltG [Patescibacteria group bacterium]MCG2694732.1 endolytic transglycosylase MltG [Candidatus Parcubacteria bacterium]